ncbi:MAG: helix-turn-helix transcriptional regulator [Bacteroidota bacterium]|nr:MAG: helix-turn-helix transcriptional regulator [Bacteroidota bacterium]
MDELKKLQLIFQTLSDYNRLGILKSIADKECAVGEIVKATNLSQPLVSHHLKILKENGILETKRNGPFIFYYLRDNKILYAINLFLELFENSEIKQNPGYRFCPDWIIHKYNTNE